MKKIVLCLALASLLVMGGQAFADICTVDDRPAATLLVPYFEVDLTSSNGVTTLFEINNASAVSQIAHVVVWSDLSVPVLDFNVYLTGYDIVPINMRDVLNLDLPQTAPPTQTPGVSNVGLFSIDPNPVNVLTQCADQLPPPQINPSFATGVQNALTGQPSSTLGGNCGGVAFGDDIARGYVTVDVVRSCNLQFPGDAGYFVSGGQGEALNDNVLWGNWYLVDPANNFAQGETLVHVEADALNANTSGAGDYTFYGRYVDFTGADNREPLATNFAARYLTDPGSGFDGTDFLVWRDSKLELPSNGFSCAAGPTSINSGLTYPLGQEDIVIFDEEENPEVPQVFPISPQPPEQGIIPFPWETQRVAVNGPGGELTTTFDNGWMYLNLNHTASSNQPQPADPAAAQAWVTPVIFNGGLFSVGYDAVQIDSACAANHSAPGN